MKPPSGSDWNSARVASALSPCRPSLALEKARLPSIKGSVPGLSSVPPGCPFHPRCPHAKAGICDQGAPPVSEALSDTREVACLRWEEVTSARARARVRAREEEVTRKWID